MASRRVRAFKRWMTHNNIVCSDVLSLIDDGEQQGISVKAVCDLLEGDVVSTIPKQACLTMKTSRARESIELADLDGTLGLAIALMYEFSLGEESKWAGYLQLLPFQEPLPLVWSVQEIDSLLRGTELHKTVKEDQHLVVEDWKECIFPLLSSPPFSSLDPKFFSVESYFAAKTLIASRSFQIDVFHGAGMVPLADLFNHKTGAEDVHFSSHYESESDQESVNDDEDAESSDTVSAPKSEDVRDLETATTLADDSTDLEMIMIKNVTAGSEVFNTYGCVGNAALLHRYGFTEPDNPFDIVNIDLDVVLRWSNTMFSSRHSRARLSLWRRLNYAGCVSQDSEYFEISYNGEPQMELLALLHILLLSEDAYCQLDLMVSTEGNLGEPTDVILPKESKLVLELTPETSKEVLLTKHTGDALMSLVDIRDSLYGSNSLEDDIEALKQCCCIKERKLYHSLMLRVSERKVLQKLRAHAAAAANRGDGSLVRHVKRGSTRKSLKRTRKGTPIAET